MPSVQATEVTYELQSLGWKAFQDLCLTILSELMGQTVQTFQTTADGGRDGAFSGAWTPHEGLQLSGTFTIQCKFTSKQGARLTMSVLSDELKKAKRLVQRGFCDNYILMTNFSVSGPVDEQLRNAFREVGVGSFVAFGYEWICTKIKESPRLRMLVPRIYGLGDLGQILDQRAYEQTEEILASLSDDLRKFVLTQAHRRAAQALIEHGFVMLLGEPASGKSMIASVLAVGANDMWDCFPIKIENAEEFRNHWSARESRQLFWVDDAFGSTTYQPQMTLAWNQQLPAIAAAVKRGSKVLFTSRDYIFSAARSDLKMTVFPLLTQSQVIINVQDLTNAERDQIVYNHMKLGEQTKQFKRRIKPFLPYVGKVPHFLPEIARRLGTPFFTKNLGLSRQSVIEFAKEPIGILNDILSGLSDNHKSALALIFMNAGQKESPIEFTTAEEAAIERIGGSTAGVLTGLKHLDGSLVKLERVSGRLVWNFKHPTIRDAFATLVSRDPELLDVYLGGTPMERIMEEVTCGDIGLDGVKVVVPTSRFATFAHRLDGVRGEELLQFYDFLGTRCSREFLRAYLKDRGDILDEITSNALAFGTRIKLVVTLRSFDLLPEEFRKNLVRRVLEQVVEDPTGDFLAIEASELLFTPSERAAILKAVRTEVVENISEIVSGYEDGFDPGEGKSPEEYFSDLELSVQSWLETFSDDTEAQQLLERGREDIQAAIETLNENLPPEPDYDDEMASISERNLENSQSGRSIFDDVDD